ncbi:MAG: hypothetical protein DBX55_06360 [Verrucomicrobia bacterium]|nr:MAG: hypothetical protein DBX55_06360 [Verrucomicrobiota bacterium]
MQAEWHSGHIPDIFLQSGHAFAKKRAAKFNFGKIKLNLDNTHSRKILEMGKKQGQAQGALGNGVKALQCRLKRLRRLGQIGGLADYSQGVLYANFKRRPRE